jgi:hypothetical protein
MKNLRDALNRVTIDIISRVRTLPAHIHIPKTGGTYIGQRESTRKPVIWPVKRLGHIAVVHDKEFPNQIYYPHNRDRWYHTILLEDLKRYVAFATVRNPFTWLVSYAAHAGGWNPRYLNVEHYDYENAQKGFEYLIKTIANRETPWPCRKFIFFQVFCSNGELAVDWITRTETLDNDLEDLARFTGVNYAQSERQRTSGIQDYRAHYNAALVELVSETWGRELDLYGYTFDGLDLDSARLRNQMDEEARQPVRYDWTSDTLTA